jgi:hypothetical protein
MGDREHEKITLKKVKILRDIPKADAYTKQALNRGRPPESISECV